MYLTSIICESLIAFPRAVADWEKPLKEFLKSNPSNVFLPMPVAKKLMVSLFDMTRENAFELLRNHMPEKPTLQCAASHLM